MPTADYTPAVADVGAVLRSRTVDNVGAEQGTFTATTRPTADEVTAIIAQAVGEVVAEHGDPDVPADVDPSLMYGMLKREAVLTSAMQVELTYFPEQVAANRSPYEAIRLQRDRLIPIVGKAIQELESGGAIGEGDDARLPRSNFPMQGDGVVGWNSKW